ncbi:MAG TPA: Calx-beta domain-containing protein [Xanthomonadales bacterium]|nr:Calx-beta domain-containing protein [Xanthomonadales bacterium]
MPAQRKSWLAALLLAATGPAWADNTYHNLEAGAFAQDWSNAALITANDNWSGVPSVIGYRGDGASAASGVDPQTILGEGTVTVDVNANQTNPATFNTGGVTEFALTDPVVAVAGSGTARGPSLLIHLNTSNRYNIVIGYNLRDIDGSVDNSIQPIALQYRIGSSGNFTNIPAGFVADASSGPNLATLVTPVSVTLPAAVENQPQVQLRIIGNDAVGNDEPIGIDDIVITGDPPPPPAVTIADASVTEGNPPGTTTLTFTASIPAAIADNCVFRVENFGTPPGTPATAGVDYTYPSPDPEVTILAGQTSATFDVTIVRDTLVEGDEQFVLSAYGEPFACDIFGMGDIIGTIVDDDAAAPPDISIANVSQVEGNTGTTLALMTVSLSSPAPAGGVTVQYATADAGASAALGDYVAASGTVSFAPGELTQTIPITINGDTYFEFNETVNVTLSGAVGGNIVGNIAQLTIVNDDVAPTLQVADVGIIEGTGAGTTTLVFTATLSAEPAPDQPAMVDYSTASGSALAGTDFTAASSTLSFTNGTALTRTINVPITRDNIDESDETFTLTLSNVFNAQIPQPTATGTIQDDDTAVVSINNVSQNEGNVGASSMDFTVSLSVPAASSRFFGAFTADGTAVAPGDYNALPLGPTSVVFAPGETTKTVSVQINGDTTVEADESFTLNLADAATIEGSLPPPAASGTGTIVNDDVPSVSVGDASVTEGTGAGATNAVFTVTLTEQPQAGSPVTVNYATTGISATSGSDFTATSGALTFSNGGALTQTVSVPITRDNIDEDDELFAFDILASGANVTDGKGEGSIVDDDTAVVSINNVSQNEGNAGTTNFVFTLSLSTPSASTLEYSVFTTDGSATAGSDYIGIPAPGDTVVFPPLSTTQTLTVTVNGDTAVEADETFNALVLFALPVIEGGPTPVATGVGTIVNDDVAVNIGINDVSVTEGTGAGSTNAVFTVTLSAQPPVGAPVSVSYSTAGGSATSGTDFTATSGTLTFNNGGALTQTISVPVTRDNIDESNEGFVVDITATGGTLTDGQGAGTILDDDGVPTPSIGNLSVTEGNSGLSTATFTVTLSNPSAFALVYQASTADGSAVAPGDYQAIAAGLNNVNFAPLQTTQTISVNVVGELLVEANETFILDLRAAVPTDGTAPVLASGTATISNDDSATLSISGSSGPEGNAGTTARQFTATLSNPVQAQVQVNYATADASATVADNDYQAANGTLTFAGSTTTQSFNVNVVGDLEVEPDQSFAVALSGLNAPAGVTLGTATASSTIVNDDATSFSIAGASVTEGTGANATLNFVVSLSAPAKDPVSVQYATVNGSAVAPADYTAASGTLTFSGGQTTQTIAITVIGDNLVEADESLQVQLSNPTGGTLVTASATGTLVNDDNAVLAITDVTQPEGNGNGSTPFVFTISASNPSHLPITVNYQTSEGSAVTPSDFASGSGSVTIPALATSVSVTVNVVADNVLEPTETFTVTLSGAQGATIGDAVGVGTILGDDELIAVPTLDPRSLGLLIALMLALGMVGIARRR